MRETRISERRWGAGETTETCDNTEICDKSDDDSNMSPLIIKQEIYVMSSCDDSDDKTMCTEMLKDIYDSSKSRLIANRR